MNVLVIIVTYNAMKWASRCFNSILRSKQQVDVYIVDNGSSDGTQDFIRENYPQFKFIQSKENLGFGAVNNWGFQYALDNNYDFVYLINQDAWIFPETIGKLIAIFQKNQDYGVLSPMQYSGDETTLDEGFNKIFSRALTKNPNSGVVDVPFIMAAHWFLPIDVIKKVGGFSPTFYHYGEDLNYIDRIKYYGYKIGVVKSSKSVHDRYSRGTTNEKLFYLKNVLNLSRLSNPRYPFPLNLLIAFFYSCAYSLKSMNQKPIRGMINNLKNLREIKVNYNISKLKKAFLK